MKIGLAILGAGSVVQGRHLPAIHTIPELEVRAVYDPDKTAAEQAATAAGARVALSPEEAVRAAGVDAVLVASPNVFHRAGVEAAAGAGKHIFCEKPIATNLRDARAILDATARAGLVLQLGFHHRFMSEFRLARRLLDAGLIGEVRAFQTMMSEPLSVIPGGAANYRLRKELSGGLTLIDFGSHRIDQMRALLGDVAEVSAAMDAVGSHGLDDNVTVTIRTRAGAIGAMSFHRFSGGAVSPATLLGTRGTLCFNSWVTNPFHAAPVVVFAEEPLPDDVLAFTRPRDWWSAPQPGWTALWPPFENPYAAEWRAFVAAIAEGSPPPVTGEDGYKALEIVLAAYKAFRERRAIPLPLEASEEIPLPTFR